MDKTTIELALEYYDVIHDKFEPLFAKVVSRKNNIFYADSERNNITYYDADGNALLTSEYEILGIYNNTKKIWTWGWAEPSTKKNEIFISRKILNYGFDVDIDDLNMLKSELITSRFSVSNKIQIEIHIALGVYLSKKVVYKYIEEDSAHTNKITYYIFLLDVDLNMKI